MAEHTFKEYRTRLLSIKINNLKFVSVMFVKLKKKSTRRAFRELREFSDLRCSVFFRRLLISINIKLLRMNYVAITAIATAVAILRDKWIR